MTCIVSSGALNSTHSLTPIPEDASAPSRLAIALTCEQKTQKTDAIILPSVDQLTLGRDGFVVVVTAEQTGAVQNLVQYDGEAVHVSLLSSSRHSGDRSSLSRHQFRRRPQQRYNTTHCCDYMCNNNVSNKDI